MKLVYKDLVRVRKNPDTQLVEITTEAFKVKSTSNHALYTLRMAIIASTPSQMLENGLGMT